MSSFGASPFAFAARNRNPALSDPRAKCSRPDAASFVASQELPQPLDLGFGRGDEIDLVQRGDRVQLVANAADIAAEPLDRLERQVAMHAGRARGQLAVVHTRKAAALGQHRGDRVASAAGCSTFCR